jgi:hypothetical protein
MGALIYGVAPAIEISDRALRHLQVVITAKLRRQESFQFTWDGEPDVEGDDAAPHNGRHGSVWISQGSSLYFSFDSPLTEPLNRDWIELLTRAASSPGGLRVLPEPERDRGPEGSRNPESRPKPESSPGEQQ